MEFFEHRTFLCNHPWQEHPIDIFVAASWHDSFLGGAYARCRPTELLRSPSRHRRHRRPTILPPRRFRFWLSHANPLLRRDGSDSNDLLVRLYPQFGPALSAKQPHHPFGEWLLPWSSRIPSIDHRKPYLEVPCTFDSGAEHSDWRRLLPLPIGICGWKPCRFAGRAFVSHSCAGPPEPAIPGFRATFPPGSAIRRR